MKKFSDIFSRHVEYGWQILGTKVTAVESGMPSCSAFIKVASTNTAKNGFRRKLKRRKNRKWRKV